MAGVGVRKHRGKWYDRFGNILPKDNYHNVQPVFEETIVDDEPVKTKVKGAIRITNPDVAKDIRSGSFVFGGISRLAAKRRTNKRHKAKNKQLNSA